jgi:hypothetical protein
MEATASSGSSARSALSTSDLPFSAVSPLSTSAFGSTSRVAAPSAATPATSPRRSIFSALSASPLKQPSSSRASKDRLFASSVAAAGQRPASTWRFRWSGECGTRVARPSSANRMKPDAQLMPRAGSAKKSSRARAGRMSARIDLTRVWLSLTRPPPASGGIGAPS